MQNNASTPLKEMSRMKIGIWVSCVAISLVSALTYDHYRNQVSQRSQSFVLPTKVLNILIRNPIDLQNPSESKLGHIEGHINATQLFEEFSENEKQATRKYVGKTYLIEGSILETFDLEVETVDNLSAWYIESYSRTEHMTGGIMLLPETEGFRREIGARTSGELTLPLPVNARMDAGAYEKLYERFLNANHPGFKPLGPHRRLYHQYSDDFSFQSNFGGVYCMFSKRYSLNRYSVLPQRKKITTACKIREYRKGGIEEIEQYKLRDNAPNKVKTKSRVIAIGCVEINYEVAEEERSR